MHTIEARSKQTFLRNEFESVGKWDIPLVKKQKLDTNDINLISYSDIKSNDIEINKKKGVHFFIDDWRMNVVYYDYEKTFSRLNQYKFLLTPDYSLYADMPRAIQLYNVFRNRWCGAYWQSQGMTAIPTISWSSPENDVFCFDGVETNSIVAISTLGCKKANNGFMRGYNAMLERLNPEAIICLGSPIKEMTGNIIPVDYNESRKVVRYGR